MLSLLLSAQAGPGTAVLMNPGEGMRLITSPRELFTTAAASRDTDDDDDDDDDYDEPASTSGRPGLRGGGKQGKSMAPQAWGGLKHVSLSCLLYLFLIGIQVAQLLLPRGWCRAGWGVGWLGGPLG